MIMKTLMINHKHLSDFIEQLMNELGVPDKDAISVAINLVTSSLRGIDSHGAGQLKLYVAGIESGFIIPDAKPEVVKESPVLALVNANNGLGQISGIFSMRLAIQKAQEMGIGLVSVFNSNHYGFAGYYAMMSLEHNLIGMTMTNSPPLIIPTFGKNAMIGSNPIAMAVPTKSGSPWVLDMSTSVVPIGKIDVYSREGKEIPPGWATDGSGRVTTNPLPVLNNMYASLEAGGVFPLGGEGEIHGGHKGYGLATMVDILSGILSGANFGRDVVFIKDGKANFPNIGHFFLALDPSFFIDIEQFKERMDDMISKLRNSEKAHGQSRIFIHGEKEFEEYERRIKNGIPLDKKTIEVLKKFSEDFNVELKLMNE